MTIYCTGEEGTYLSINGGDFVTYPPGSDIEVVSVNVAAYLFSEHYRASWASGGCTNWQSKLYGCTNSGYLTLRAVSAPAQASLTQMLADIGGNNGIPDGCWLAAGQAFSKLFWQSGNMGCGSFTWNTIRLNGRTIDGFIDTGFQIVSNTFYRVMVNGNAV